MDSASEPGSGDPGRLMHHLRARGEHGAGVVPHVDTSQLPERLIFLLENQDITHARTISSHRPVVGPFYAMLRRWIHREVRLSVEPSVRRQSEVNQALASLLVEQHERIELLENRVAQLEQRLSVALNGRSNGNGHGNGTPSPENGR